jgi:hypothetical protein
VRQIIDISDVFFLFGLALTGTGLFFLHSLGLALTVCGGLFLFLGLIHWWARMPKAPKVPTGRKVTR